MKSKLLNDKINCSELVLVSGAPLFHVMKSVLLLPCAGLRGIGGMSGGYRGLQEAGERSLDLDSVSGRPSCLPAAHFIMYLVKTGHVSSAHFV